MTDSQDAGECAASGRFTHGVSVFCFSSIGELDVILPLLTVTGVDNFRVALFKPEIAARLRCDSFYSRLVADKVQDRSTSGIPRNRVLRWARFLSNALVVFWQHRRSGLFCFEYGNSGREKNLLIILLMLTGRCGRILFYPHGHAVTPDAAYDSRRWPRITKLAVKCGAKILRLDGIARPPPFQAIKYPILHPAWIDLVRAQVPQRYAQHVVILSRDAHPSYLTVENRRQMFVDVLEVFRTYFPECRVVIKAHPRETIGRSEVEYLESVEITYDNTYAIVRGASFVVSFWTSAFFQCMALGVPVVEYHLPHAAFKSLYPTGSPNAAFVPSFTDKRQLIRFVQSLRGAAASGRE